MSAQLSAKFDSRDAADLALMKLRSNGISFSVARLSVLQERQMNPDSGEYSVVPYNLGPVNMVAIGTDPFIPLIGAQMVARNAAPNVSGEAVLQIKISDDQSSRAREIVRNAHGREINVK